jgi:hypothetical protein
MATPSAQTILHYGKLLYSGCDVCSLVTNFSERRAVSIFRIRGSKFHRNVDNVLPDYTGSHLIFAVVRASRPTHTLIYMRMKHKLRVRILKCNISMHGMDWIDLAHDRDQWRALVNTVVNLRVA